MKITLFQLIQINVLHSPLFAVSQRLNFLYLMQYLCIFCYFYASVLFHIKSPDFKFPQVDTSESEAFDLQLLFAFE